MLKLSLLLICFFPLASYAQWSFEERAATSGIISSHHDTKMMGGGVVIFDYNNDGHEDIYLTGGLFPDKLFKNNGTGRFTDVSYMAGIAEVGEMKTIGAVAADLDNDSFTDLVITTDKGEQNVVLRNNGGSGFALLTPFPNDAKVWSTSIAVADYNLDGLLDIYFLNYVEYTKDPFFTWRASGINNTLYQNSGDFRFTDVTEATRTVNKGASLAGTFSDYDNDGDPDLFVVNDFGYEFGGNTLYINNYPDEAFSEIDATSGVRAEVDGMGIAVGDYNGDGTLDYYVSNLLANLMLENINGIFANVAEEKGLALKEEISWGTVFADINNDGRLDLFVANGSMTDPNVKQENRFFLQNENGDFKDVTPGDKFYNKSVFRGAAAGDLNNDGRMDFISVGVSQNGIYIPALVFINTGNDANNWLKVKLKGTLSNKDGIGAKVRVFVDQRSQVREVNAGSSYLSHNSSVAHFGLGENEFADSVTIEWPGAGKETYYNIAANRFLLATQGEGIDVMETSVVTGLEDRDPMSSFHFYPNPVIDVLNIEIPEQCGEPAFALYNQLGEKIAGLGNIEKTSTHTFEISIDERVGSGIYIILVSHNHGTSRIKLLKR